MTKARIVCAALGLAVVAVGQAANAQMSPTLTLPPVRLVTTPICTPPSVQDASCLQQQGAINADGTVNAAAARRLLDRGVCPCQDATTSTEPPRVDARGITQPQITTPLPAPSIRPR